MQQFCNTCGAPITAGMTACARCGTPVGGGSGAYDPTVRVGTPPGTGYGPQSYGPPPTDPYGAPPPPPGYGSQPQSGFGAPQQGYGPPPMQQGYGAPPPPPGFGPPPQPGFGAPQQPYMAPMGQPPKKSRTWLYVVGAILVVLIIACVGGIFAIRALGNAASNAINNLSTQVATQLPTSGAHVSNVQIGKGDDQGNITTQATSFGVGEHITITFTGDTQDSGAKVSLKIDASGGQSQVLGDVPLDTGSNSYYMIFHIDTAGSYTAELQYTGGSETNVTESHVDFTVS